MSDGMSARSSIYFSVNDTCNICSSAESCGPDGQGTEETRGAPRVKEGGQEAVLKKLPPDLMSLEEGGVPFSSWQHVSTV